MAFPDLDSSEELNAISSWLEIVFGVKAKHDIDTNLVIRVNSQIPTRGLQFMIGDALHKFHGDEQAMAMFGIEEHPQTEEAVMRSDQILIFSSRDDHHMYIPQWNDLQTMLWLCNRSNGVKDLGVSIHTHKDHPSPPSRQSAADVLRLMKYNVLRRLAVHGISTVKHRPSTQQSESNSTVRMEAKPHANSSGFSNVSSGLWANANPVTDAGEPLNQRSIVFPSPMITV